MPGTLQVHDAREQLQGPDQFHLASEQKSRSHDLAVCDISIFPCIRTVKTSVEISYLYTDNNQSGSYPR